MGKEIVFKPIMKVAGVLKEGTYYNQEVKEFRETVCKRFGSEAASFSFTVPSGKALFITAAWLQITRIGGATIDYNYLYVNNPTGQTRLFLLGVDLPAAAGSAATQSLSFPEAIIVYPGESVGINSDEADEKRIGGFSGFLTDYPVRKN